MHACPKSSKAISLLSFPRPFPASFPSSPFKTQIGNNTLTITTDSVFISDIYLQRLMATRCNVFFFFLKFFMGLSFSQQTFNEQVQDTGIAESVKNLSFWLSGSRFDPIRSYYFCKPITSLSFGFLT